MNDTKQETNRVYQDAQPDTLLDSVLEKTESAVAARERYMPVMSIKDAIDRHKYLQSFIREIMIEGEDYGTIPGTDKPCLLQAGAQKLCSFFGYAPDYEESSIEDWNGAQHGEPLFYYKIKCTLRKDGQPVGQGIGSANSWESKYRYRWVVEPPAHLDKSTLPRRDTTISEFGFAIDKAETGGQYGKPAEYWNRWKEAIKNGQARQIRKKAKGNKEYDGWEMGGTAYRVPNDQFPDVINTTQKMAAKRAYVAATLTATGASQHFTQDLDEMGEVEPPRQAMKEPPKAKPESLRDKAMAILEPAAKQGTAALEMAWNTLSKNMRKEALPEMPRLKEEAAQVNPDAEPPPVETEVLEPAF